MKWIKKILKIIVIILLILLLFILAIGIIYWINPDYVERKAMDWFFPTVNIHEDYVNKITTESHEVYELMQSAASLTPTFQNDANLLDQNSEYYQEFKKHFDGMETHPLVVELESLLMDNAYGENQMALRLLALDYDINDKNELTSSNTLNVSPILLSLFQSQAFLIPKHLESINDFAEKSDFKSFYEKHESDYQQMVDNYNQLCDFQDMKNWLEKKSPTEYQSYRILFSPLTKGFHNTMHFKDKKKNMEQTFMFVNAPKIDLDTLSEKELEFSSSRWARVVFTEIDHNYVNPTTDKFLIELDEAMPDFTKWNSKKSGYQSNYATFNEYMTWGIFSLYAMDTYSEENVQEIIDFQVDFISKRRKFFKFKSFNDELMKLYKEHPNYSLEDFYKPMLEWIKNN